MTETVIWVVTAFHACTDDGEAELDGIPVVAICDTELLARQVAKTSPYSYHAQRFVVGTDRQSAMFR